MFSADCDAPSTPIPDPSPIEGEGLGATSFMKQLIVTADDFGAALAVNEAVERAHTEGVLSAASLMVGAPATEDAVARARRLPQLRIGLHLVLVEGRSLLGPERLPDLVGLDGYFRTDMARMGADIFFKPQVRRQLADEITAQFEAYAATELPLDHVNTHKHYQLHPTIAGAVIRIGRQHSLKATRAPAEPRAVLARADPASKAPPAYVTAPWAEFAKRRFRRAGLATADHVFGLNWSGAMTRDRVLGLIRNLPPGLTELYTHPATANAYEGSAPGYRYVDEFEALIDPEVVAEVRRAGIALGGFTDFAGASR